MLNGMEQMAPVGCTGQRSIARYEHLVARFPEPGNQGRLGAIVIEIKVHLWAGTSAGA